MATLSPVNPRWASVADRLWPLLKWLQRRGHVLPKDANKLSMISFARWSLVRKVPPKEGTRTLVDVRLPTPYILFETNYNGDTDQYFEAFSYTSGMPITLVWMGTYGKPPVKRVGAFIRFINDNKSKPAAFYTAYPQDSAKTIRSSLEVKWLHCSLKKREPKMDDAKFLREYKKFLRDAQKQDPPLRTPYRDRRRKKQWTTGLFTAITPFDITKKTNLKNDLANLQGEWAPDTTHFARMIPIEEVMWRTLPRPFKDKQPVRSCLVFGASFDGEKKPYLRKLYEREDIWRHCDGWPGEDGKDDEESFVEYMLDHEYVHDFPYSPYDGVPREDIDKALDLNQRVWKFAEENQERTIPAKAGELRQCWLARFDP
jgi:hypothetical protein